MKGKQLSVNQDVGNTIRRRYETCEFLLKFLKIDMDQQQTCEDFQCYEVCPLQELGGIEGEEQRRCKRKAKSIKVKYGEKFQYTAVTTDISLGGLGLKVDHLLLPGKEIFVKIPGQKNCVAKAEVVWRKDTWDNPNMGIKFGKVTKAFGEYLRGLLISNAEMTKP